MTYDLEACLSGSATGASNIQYGWYLANGTQLPNSTVGGGISPTYTSAGVIQDCATAIYTPSVDTYVKVVLTYSASTFRAYRGSNIGGTADTGSSFGGSYAKIRQIGGNKISLTPMEGTYADYVLATLNGNQTINMTTSGQDMPIFTNQQQNIGEVVYKGNGVYTLKANKTYKIKCGLSMIVPSNGHRMGWYISDSSNNVLGSYGVSWTDSSGNNVDTQREARVTITPTQDMDIKIRQSWVSSTGNYTFSANSNSQGHCYLEIQQLG